MAKKGILPTIIGMNPPTKEILIFRGSKPCGQYQCIIQHADFPDGTQPGQKFSLLDNSVDRKGVATWLTFTDKDAMKDFGQMLVDFANGRAKDGNDREEKQTEA